MSITQDDFSIILSCAAMAVSLLSILIQLVNTRLNDESDRETEARRKRYQDAK